jgi:calnexin
MKFLCLSLVSLAAASDYEFPSTDNFVYAETFEQEFTWITSSDPDYVNQPIEVSVDKDLKSAPYPNDKTLILLEGAKKYGLVGSLKEPMTHTDGKPIVLQYEVKFTEGLTCGGAYLKLLQTNVDFNNFNGQSPYTIMFGPDHCGATNKIHFILQHKNPVSGVFEEKHAVTTAQPVTDTSTHLYTLVIRPDNSWEILVDLESKSTGNLLEDMKPPINPSTTIDDPSDFKPDDWVDTKRIKDESATKPDDWDEDAPQKIPDSSATMPSDWILEEEPEIPDPSASMPDDWDEEEDGDWEAPTIPNPKCKKVSGCGEWTPPLVENPDYKGKWYPPLIDNPDYIGEWQAKQIENPYYFEDLKPLSNLAPISGVAIEIWTMTGGIRFDNIILTESEEDAVSFATKTWSLKSTAEKNIRKQLSKEERREDLERKRAEGGIANLIEVYVNDFVDFVADNFIVVMGSLLVGLIGLVFICSKPGNSDAGNANEKRLNEEQNRENNAAAEEEESDDGEEEEEDSVDENEVSLAGTAKKVAKEEAEAEVEPEEKKK